MQQIKIFRTYLFKILQIILIILFFIACQIHQSSNSFQLKGKILGLTQGIIYIKKFNGITYTLYDSVAVENYIFKYKGYLKYPELFRFQLKGSSKYFSVFIENSSITVTTDIQNLKKIEVTGSKSHQLYQSLIAKIDSINRHVKTLVNNEIYTNDTKTEIMQILNKAKAEQVKWVKDFVKKNKHHVISLYAIYFYLTNEISIDEYKLLFDITDKNLHSSPYALYIEQQLDYLNHNQIGNTIYPISLPDTTGCTIYIRSYKGSYLLLHFWSSYCKPCFNDLQFLKQLTHQKRIKILSIAFDHNRTDWLKAIRNNSMNWFHASELRGINNSLSRVLSISQLPYYIVISPEQQILIKSNNINDIVNYFLTVKNI